jgi:hypothetical protein
MKTKIHLLCLILKLTILAGCIPTYEKISYEGRADRINGDGNNLPKPPTGGNAEQSSIGIKNFNQLNLTMAALTGVDPMVAKRGFDRVSPTLPTDNSINVFHPSHQVAITSLAAEYCHHLVESAELRSRIWPDFDFTLRPRDNAFSGANRTYLVREVISSFWGPEVTEAEREQAENELLSLFDVLLLNERTDLTNTTRNVVKGVCMVALGSAQVTLL